MNNVASLTVELINMFLLHSLINSYVLLGDPITPNSLSRVETFTYKRNIISCLINWGTAKSCWSFSITSFIEVLFKIGLLFKYLKLFLCLEI